VTELQGYGIFEPIEIHYDGMDASHHQMELLTLGQSFQGAARIIGVTGNFVFSGKYIRRQPAMAVRVLALPPRESSFSILAVIAAVHGALPIAPQEMTKIAEQIIKYMLARFSSKPAEAAVALDVAKTALIEMGQTTRAQTEVLGKAIEALAEAQRANVRLLVAPIGETCDTMFVGNPSRDPLILNRESRAAIDAVAAPELLKEKNYDVTITEIDIKRHTCKLSLHNTDEPDQRYDGEISDPVIDQPNDPYSMAVTNKTPVRVRAKVEIKDGDFHKFFISDIGQIAP
jgi:hypothetical protein